MFEKLGKWNGEKRPIFLAPMAGVTDLPYRLLARECGADFTITEFTNSTALSRKATTSWAKMESHPDENPFIPQIFGGDVDDMVTAAILLSESADIIDLNFGCPAPKVTKICAGAALMGEPENLVNMVEQIISNVDVPVTAKMRLGTGSGENNVLEISKELEKIGVSRICIHGRTLKQRYMGVADWDLIAKVVQAVDVPVIANGDVVDAKSAAACLKHTSASGLMIGRGAIGRPNIFAEIKLELGWMNEEEIPWMDEEWYQLDELQQQFATRSWCWNRYVELCRETTGLRAKWMKRHAISFTKGLPGSKKVRSMMHETSSLEDFNKCIQEYLDEGKRLASE